MYNKSQSTLLLLEDWHYLFAIGNWSLQTSVHPTIATFLSVSYYCNSLLYITSKWESKTECALFPCCLQLQPAVAGWFQESSRIGEGRFMFMYTMAPGHWPFFIQFSTMAIQSQSMRPSDRMQGQSNFFFLSKYSNQAAKSGLFIQPLHWRGPDCKGLQYRVFWLQGDQSIRSPVESFCSTRILIRRVSIRGVSGD